MRFLPVQGVTTIVLLFLVTVSIICYVTNVCIHSLSEARWLAMSSRCGNTSSMYKLCMVPPSFPSCKHRLSSCASTISSSCQWNRTQTYTACANIIHTVPNDCSTTGHLPFLVWDGVRAPTGKLRSRNNPPVCKMLVFIDFCGFCLRIPGVAHIVRPHLDY